MWGDSTYQPLAPHTITRSSTIGLEEAVYTCIVHAFSYHKSFDVPAPFGPGVVVLVLLTVIPIIANNCGALTVYRAVNLAFNAMEQTMK